MMLFVQLLLFIYHSSDTNNNNAVSSKLPKVRLIFLELQVQSDLVSCAAFSQNNAVATTWLAWERTA